MDTELSRRLNRYLNDVVTAEKHYTFHSSRHEFKDRSINSGIDPKISDRITGHVDGTVGDQYGFGASIPTICAELNKLNTAFVDLPLLMRAAGRL